MEYHTRTADDTVYYHLAGQLTFQDYGKMNDLIQQMAAANTSVAAFDLSDLHYLDSSGISMFIVAKDEMAKQGKTFKLRAPIGQVKDVLVAMQMQKMMAIETA